MRARRCARPLRHRGAVVRWPLSVTLELAADRRRAPPQLPSNRPHAAPQCDGPTNFLALHRTQMAIALTHGNTPVSTVKVLHLLLETTLSQNRANSSPRNS